MQPHPDRGELKLYLRGYASAPVAHVIKQHLLVCDQCVSDALVEYDHLDQARAATTTPPAITSLVPAAKATIVIRREPRLRYAWAALLPIATAVGLVWTAGRGDSQFPWRIKAGPVIEQFQVSQLTPPTNSLQVQPVNPVEIDPTPVKADTSAPKAIKRNRIPADTSQKVARETRVARFYVVSARTSARQPVLLQPVEVHAPVVKSETLHSSAALSLVSREPSLAPPPQRRGLKRVFSVLAAPFRKS